MNLCVQDPGFIQKIVSQNIFRNMDIKLINNSLKFPKINNILTAMLLFHI